MKSHLVGDDEHLVVLHVATLPGAEPGVRLAKGRGALRNWPPRQLLRKDGVPAQQSVEYLSVGYAHVCDEQVLISSVLMPVQCAVDPVQCSTTVNMLHAG